MLASFILCAVHLLGSLGLFCFKTEFLGDEPPLEAGVVARSGDALERGTKVADKEVILETISPLIELNDENEEELSSINKTNQSLAVGN